jgi:hypothetical protein
MRGVRPAELPRVIGAWGLCILVAGSVVGQPRLALSHESWDFGRVTYLSQLDFTLTVSNQGDENLRIERVKSSCGCTTAQPGKHTLQPGESTTIAVAFNTRGKDGPTDARLTIITNDPQNPETIFPVSGTVEHLVRITPRHRVIFQLLDSQEVQTHTLRLENQAAEPIKPVVLPRTDWLTIDVHEIEPGRVYDLALTNRTPVTAQVQSVVIPIDTGLAQQPRAELTAQSLMIDRVRLQRPVLMLLPRPDRNTTATVTVEYHGSDRAFRVTEVVCQDRNLPIQLVGPLPPPTDAPGRAPTSVTHLTIEIPPRYTTPAAGLLFTVRTNDPEFPELTFRGTTSRDRYRELLQNSHDSRAAAAGAGS